MQSLTITWGKGTNIVHLTEGSSWSVTQTGAAKFEVAINGDRHEINLTALDGYKVACGGTPNAETMRELLNGRIRIITYAWRNKTAEINLDFSSATTDSH